MVLNPYHMMYSNIVKEIVFQYIEHGILRYDFVYDIALGTSSAPLDFWSLQDNDYNAFQPSFPSELTQ